METCTRVCCVKPLVSAAAALSMSTGLHSPSGIKPRLQDDGLILRCSRTTCLVWLSEFKIQLVAGPWLLRGSHAMQRRHQSLLLVAWTPHPGLCRLHRLPSISSCAMNLELAGEVCRTATAPRRRRAS